jgi:hypothetical protein
MAEPPPIRILNTEEAAAAMRGTQQGGKDVETLRRWRKRNIGPPFIEIGKIAYYRSDMLEFNLPIQGRVNAFPPSWEEEQSLNEILLLRLLLLRVLENWEESRGYNLSLDGESTHFKSRVEVEVYLKALKQAIFAIEKERLDWEPSETMVRGKERQDTRESVSGNRVLGLLNRLVESAGRVSDGGDGED